MSNTIQLVQQKSKPSHNIKIDKIRKIRNKSGFNTAIIKNANLAQGSLNPIKINIKNVTLFPKQDVTSRKLTNQTSPENSRLITIQNQLNQTEKVLSGRKKAVLGIEPAFKTVTSNETTNKLEKLIKDMLIKDKLNDQLSANDFSVKQGQTIQDQKYERMGSDALNLSSFLDVKIQSQNTQSQAQSSIHFKDEPPIQTENVFEKTIAAQRKDIIALQEIEKSKQQIQKRIKERYSVLRSISRKANPRKAGSTLPPEVIVNQRILSNSNIRPSTNKYDFHPYQQINQSLNSMIGQSNKTTKRVKRQNNTTFINPSVFEFNSGRITSLYGNSIMQNQSPTVLSKTSTIQNNTSIVGYEPSQTQASIMSAKKISRIQRKKIVINDNFSSIQREQNITELSPEMDLKQGRADSVPLQPFMDQNYTNLLQNAPISMLSDEYDLSRSHQNQSKRESRPGHPANFNIRQKLNFRYIPGEDPQKYGTIDSIRELEEQEETKRDKMNIDHIKIQDRKFMVSDSIAMNQSMPIDQINQILNTQDIDPIEINGQNQDSVFNSPQNNQDFVFQSNIINSKNIQFKNGWREQGDTDSAGMSKTTLSTQRPLLSGGVLGVIGNLQHQQTNQNKLASKIKLVSYQKGRFSSDSSFIKLRQTYQQNILFKHSTAIDGEDSQCKFEGDLEREDHKFKPLKEEVNQLQLAFDMSVGQIKEEEEYVEEEDSKNSRHQLKQPSMVSSTFSSKKPNPTVLSKKQRRDYADYQSEAQEESVVNLLNSNRTEIVSVDNNEITNRYIKQDTNPIKNLKQNKWLLENNDSEIVLKSHTTRNQNEILHSDDEVDIRRGLEPSTNRSLNPREPEFLRQSTHSLLGIKKNNGKNRENQNMLTNIVDDQEDDELRAQLDIELDDNCYINEVQDDSFIPSRLCLNNNSYENYLKNADNFIS
eukprot:403333736